MSKELLDLVNSNAIFSTLDQDARNHLFSKFSLFEIKQNTILFEQGDLSDHVFLIVSGKLAVTYVTEEMRRVSHVEAGDVLGALDVLSNKPRSLSAKALKDTKLLRLPAEEFSGLCYQFPAMMFATIHPVLDNHHHLVKNSNKKNYQHVVCVPANKSIILKDFFQKILEFTANLPNLLVLSDYQDEFKNKNVDAAALKQTVYTYIDHKKNLQRIIYILESYDTPLAKYALKNADMTYVVGTSHSLEFIDNHILDKFRHLHFSVNPGLILLHLTHTVAPLNTLRWLHQLPFSMCHHVRMDHHNDFHRLIRFMRGKPVGLVLSGGGTRGWAHLGAIRALQEADIPIDMIGGTSVGALVAACYATSSSYEETYDKFQQIVTISNSSVSWRSVTWPAVSLFTAKNFTEIQKKIFRDQRIEDLWLPFYCISSNLATNKEEIHQNGLLWEKTRASASVPGIIPPMIINGEIHYDGGLLNNLPVDVMRQMIGDKGKIIAIELNNFAPLRVKYNFPPILTLKDALLEKLGLGKNKYHFPRFMDTFWRGMFVGSLVKSKQNGLYANILVCLHLSSFRLLHSNSKHATRLVQIGYEETLKQIAKQKNSSPLNPSVLFEEN